MPHALIVVRDENARSHLAEVARAQAFSVSQASSAEAGLSQSESRPPDLLFLDRCFGGRTKDVLLDQIRSSAGGVAVLVGPVGRSRNGNGNGNGRAEPMPSFLSSLDDPLEAGRVEAILAGVASLVAESRDPATEPPSPSPQEARLGHLDGSSPRMRKLYYLISRAAPSRASVLVTGESGTGKERVA
ncbi:MAG: hypothetical protein EA421_15090, partial [Gemmatimonadales bacterium]